MFDLGCGDGKIPIAAARLFGATAKGIEYNPEMAALARRNIERAGVTDRVEIITGDIFDPQLQARFMQATVITTYLLPDLNVKLRPTLLKMRPGTRVVTHAFHMGEWEPDESFDVEHRDGYSWIVPTNVAGRWMLREEDGMEATIDLTQRYQRIGGTITLNGGRSRCWDRSSRATRSASRSSTPRARFAACAATSRATCWKPGCASRLRP